MLATREQLIARWETTEGLSLAEEVRQALTPTRKPGKPVATPSGGVVALAADLRQRLARLPFADEVAPQLDLRGLHDSNHDLDLIHVDLTGARLDYVYEISIISECKLDAVVLDGCRAINGSFSGDFSQVSFTTFLQHLNGTS